MNLCQLLLKYRVSNNTTFRKLIRGFCDKNDSEGLSDEFLEYLRGIGIEQSRLSELCNLPFSVMPTYLITNHSSTTYRNVKTLNGIPFDIAKSGLQKYIRRGNVEKAQYFAAEMDIFRELPEAKGNVTNFYNRLRIIVLEDVGLAAPSMLLVANEFLREWTVSRGASKALMSLIHMLAQSAHSRFYSHVRSYLRYNTPEPHVPHLQFPLGRDENLRNIVDPFIAALERREETAWYWAEKIMSREKLTEKRPRSTRPGYLIFDILKHFLTSEEEQRSLAICTDWYTTMKMKEQFLCVIHPIYLCVFNEILDWNYQEIRVTNLSGYRKSLMNQKILIDDFVCDMHTAQGRRSGKNRADFAVEGSLVAFEHFVNKEYTATYMTAKIDHGQVSLESDVFTLKARAQLTCSNARPDVYFAVDELGHNVVVKGPFLTLGDAIVSFNIQTLLGLFEGVNTYTTNVKLLIPDMFPEVPLGTRRKIEEGVPYYFVVMQDLMDLPYYPTIEKSSKVWKDEVVVDFPKLFATHTKFGFATPSTMSEEARYSLLLQLSIRYAFEIGDFAERNLLRVGNRVYNLDAEGVFVGQNLRTKKSERELLAECYVNNRVKYEDVLCSWLGSGNSFTDRWVIVRDTLTLTSEEVAKIRENIERLLANPVDSLLGL